MKESETLRCKRAERKAVHAETMRASKRAQAEAQALLAVCRSVVKACLMPQEKREEGTVRGVVKTQQGEHEFAVAGKDPREVHERLWATITNYYA